MSDEATYTTAELGRTIERLEQSFTEFRQEWRKDLDRLEGNYVTRAEFDMYKTATDRELVTFKKSIETTKPQPMGRGVVIALILSSATTIIAVASFAITFIKIVVE